MRRADMVWWCFGAALLAACGSDDGGGGGGNGGSGASSTGLAGGSGGGAAGQGGAAGGPSCGGAGPSVAATSCELGDVQAAIDSANEGDTVTIPAGQCSWTAGATVSKGLTLQGAGEGATVITASGTDLLDVNVSGGTFRLTGMGFTGTVAGGAIALNGWYDRLRIDHCRFDALSDRSVVMGYQNWNTAAPAIRGLFDHITFSNPASTPFLLIYGRDDSWEAADDYGGDNAVFIEDSAFSWGEGGPGSTPLDCEHGCRYVVRHVALENGQVQQHDTGSTQQSRGTRLAEIYDNTFSCTIGYCGWIAIGLRGGTGAIHDNAIQISGYDEAASTEIYRVTYVGGEPWTNQCDAVVDRICSNFRSHCSGGDHRACGADDECSGIGTCDDACTQNADCPSGETCLDKLDGQLDATGWPCRDQTGRGQDDPTTHEQPSSPLYWWNNTDADAPATILPIAVNTPEVPYIQLGRDYCEHDPTSACGTVQPWSYAPYGYPHPWQGCP